MNRELAEKLFEALAILDRPLSNACEKAIDTVKNDSDVEEIDQLTVKESVNLLLKGYMDLHCHLQRHHSDLNFTEDGEQLFQELKTQSSRF